MDNTLITSLLSAGVIAALITGFFSLVVSFSNNKKVTELEQMKQKFFFNQERYNGLKNAYMEVSSLKSIYVGIETFEKGYGDVITQAIKAASARFDWIEEQFEKNSIYLEKSERGNIEDLLKSLHKQRAFIHEKLILALSNPETAPAEEMRNFISNVERLEKLYKKSLQNEIDLLNT